MTDTDEPERLRREKMAEIVQELGLLNTQIDYLRSDLVPTKVGELNPPPAVDSPAASPQAEAPVENSGIGRFLAQYVVVPIISATLAASATLGAVVIASKDKEQSTTSCLQVYGTAFDLAHKIPKFRLPDSDPDEQRCHVNAVLYGSTSP